MSLHTKSKGIRGRSEHIFEMVLFSMLAALMFCSKVIMEALPNIHLIGMLTMLYTVIFRAKALIPIYLFVAVQLVVSGFHPYVMPYIYVWTILWGATMLLPKKMPHWLAAIVYPVVCSLHGFAFGALCAPLTSLLMGFDFKQMTAWIVAGFVRADVIHGISNIFAGLLVLPMTELFKKLLKQRIR